MRAFAEQTWGIYKENVIGTAAAYRYSGGDIVAPTSYWAASTSGRVKPEHGPSSCPTEDD